METLQRDWKRDFKMIADWLESNQYQPGNIVDPADIARSLQLPVRWVKELLGRKQTTWGPAFILTRIFGPNRRTVFRIGAPTQLDLTDSIPDPVRSGVVGRAPKDKFAPPDDPFRGGRSS